MSTYGISYAHKYTCVYYFTGLVNGNCPNQGRVEVYHNGMWGTVCDDFWSLDDAKVVCKQLNYQTEGAIAFTRAAFGQGTGSIILHNLNCNGHESSIFDCPHNGETIHNCGHDEDVGVFCPIPGITISVHFIATCPGVSKKHTVYKCTLQGLTMIFENT